MQVIVEGKEMQVTPALQQHAEKQSRKVTKLSDKIIGIRLYLETVKKKSNDPMANRVSYTIEIPGKDVVVTAHAPDMYEAITKASDSAARKLRKEHEKQRTKARTKKL